MQNKDYYEWLFADLDDIIDCAYETSEEKVKNEQNDGERSFEIINDFGESRRYDT